MLSTSFFKRMSMSMRRTLTITSVVVLAVMSIAAIKFFTDYPNAVPVDSDFFVLQRNQSYINASQAQIRGNWFNSPVFTGIIYGNGAGLSNVSQQVYFFSTNGIGQNPTFYGGGNFFGVYHFDEVDATSFYPTNIFLNLTNYGSIGTDGNGQFTHGTQSAYGGSSGPIALQVSGTYYMTPNNSFTNAASDTSGLTRCTLPVNGILANLYVTASSNPGAVANTVTIFTNGVSTGITVTLNNVTTAHDTTHQVAVLAGTEVGIQVVTGAGNAVRWGWGFQLQ